MAPRRVDAILASLVGLDLVLTLWGFFAPRLWYAFFHGADYVDPEGLLRRCAANWLAFFILQVIALARWRRSPMWLAVVAGCRLGDALTDVTCLAFAAHSTIFARIAFPAAGIGNLVAGVVLLRAYRAAGRPR
jgi:hypothetical protein